MTDDITPPARAAEPEPSAQPSIAIDQELQRSYLDYAMSVIIGRALDLAHQLLGG